MRKFLRGVLYTVGVLLVIAAVVVALNFTYLQRALTFFQQDQVREVGWFDPTTLLQGSESEPAIPAVDPQLASDDIFADAITYADSIDTSALLVYHQGSLVLERYASGYSADSYTQTNSLHKSVLALLVGIALDEGAIASINDPVSLYIPDWIEQPQGEITIEHLLTMASGLGKDKAAIGLMDHPLRLLHAQDIAAVARSLPQESAPGELFDYDNTNAQLLVEVLERATGQSYEAYLSAKLWSKIARNPGQLWMGREDGTPHGFCCLIAQPRDLLRLGVLILQEGAWRGNQVVPAQWIRQALKPSATNPNYGYLMWRGAPYQALRKYSAGSNFGAQHSEPFVADDLVFFDGFGGQRVYVVPSRQLVIVRVGKTQFDYDDAILPNRVMQALEGVSKHKVAVEELTIAADHAEQINVRLSYPSGGEGNYPLVVFSHGNGLSNDTYHALTDAWVESGYVVAAPRHLDSGSRDYLAELTKSVGSDWVTAARVLDLTAVIDQMGSMVPELSDFSGTVQADRVIAAGHSSGALTAQLAAGAQQEKLGNSRYPIPKKILDSRVVAVVALSSPGIIPDYLPAKTWQSLSAPHLVITGTQDTFDFMWTEHSDHFVAYEMAKPGHNYLLVLDGMDHYLGNLIGRLDRDEDPQRVALQMVSDFTLKFMHTYLDAGRSGKAVDVMQSYAQSVKNSKVLRFEQR